MVKKEMQYLTAGDATEKEIVNELLYTLRMYVMQYSIALRGGEEGDVKELERIVSVCAKDDATQTVLKTIGTAFTNGVESFNIIAERILAHAKPDADGSLEHQKACNHFYRKVKVLQKKGRYTKARETFTPKYYELKQIHKQLSDCFALKKHPAVMSYGKGDSPVKCSHKHVGQFAIFGIDIKDYFPSITRPMVESLYLTYFNDIHHLLTAANAKVKNGTVKTPTKKSMKMLAYHIGTLCTMQSPINKTADTAVLPLGIEPSVIISSSILFDIDTDVANLCRRHGYTYTRYSDNLFISSPEEHIPVEFRERIIARVNEQSYSFNDRIESPFVVHPDKNRYMPKWRHQRVLGVVVNEKANVPVRREWKTRSALNHLHHDLRNLLGEIRDFKMDPGSARMKFKRLNKRSYRVFGHLNYFSGINPDKYLKYITHRQIITMLMDELNRMLYDQGRAYLTEYNKRNKGTTNDI